MPRIFRHHVSAPAIRLAFMDLIITAVLISGVITLGESTSTWTAGGYVFSITIPSLLALFLIIGMYSTGAYERVHLGNYLHLFSRLFVCLSGCLVLIAGALYFKGGGELDAFQAHARVYVGGVLSIFPAILLNRFVYIKIAEQRGARRRVLVLGAGNLAEKIHLHSSRHPDFNTSIIGFVPMNSDEAKVPRETIISGDRPLVDIASAFGANEIVVAVTERRGFPTAPLLDCRLAGMQVTSFLSFWERETRQVTLESLDPSWLIYSDGFRARGALTVFVKRLFDISVSLAILVLTLPLTAVSILLVKFDSPGPVFYLQERTGLNGNPFNVIKLRTMRADAEKGGVPQWATARDQRITRVGSFLRLTRIDEIPQIFNVLKGDMSFVGPRPERPFFVEMLSEQIPYYRERHRLRPGITGWAQINYPYGASVEDAKAKLSYDLYYIKNQSIFFDILILLATVQVVLWNKGAR